MYHVVRMVYSFVFVPFRSICEMNLEAELFTLQDSNSKLVAALHEANANVEQWKKQLAAYQEETERLRDQVSLPVLLYCSAFAQISGCTSAAWRLWCLHILLIHSYF